MRALSPNDLIRYAYELEQVNAHQERSLRVLMQYAKAVLDPPHTPNVDLVTVVRRVLGERKRGLRQRPEQFTPEIRQAFRKGVANGEKTSVLAKALGIPLHHAQTWARQLKREKYAFQSIHESNKNYAPSETIAALRERITNAPPLEKVELDPLLDLVAKRITTQSWYHGSLTHFVASPFGAAPTTNSASPSAPKEIEEPPAEITCPRRDTIEILT
jgi:transposase-like protein